MKLFGQWNWYLPASVARIVRVEPSPLRPDDGAAVPPAASTAALIVRGRRPHDGGGTA